MTRVCGWCGGPDYNCRCRDDVRPGVAPGALKAAGVLIAIQLPALVLLARALWGGW
jgi:hypothetical protein